MSKLSCDIWRDFHDFYSQWIVDASFCYHGWTTEDDNNFETKIKEIHLNPYHEEGSVWNHVSQVFQESVKIADTLPDEQDQKELIIVALCHDLGKVMMRDAIVKPEGRKVTYFSGHEYASCFLALPFLLRYFQDQKTLERLMTVISLHTAIYKEEDMYSFVTDEKTFSLLNNLGLSDHRGRISETGDFHGLHWTGTRHYPDPIVSNDQTITLLIGIPGSGKSYFSKNMNPYGKVFSTDETMLKYAEEKCGVKNDYNRAFQNVSNSKFNWVEHTINECFEHAKTTCENVVLDATNLTKKKRNIIVRKAKSQRYKVRYIMFWRDFEKCLQKRDGNKTIPLDVYKRMMQSFSFPQIQEYDELQHIFALM